MVANNNNYKRADKLAKKLGGAYASGEDMVNAMTTIDTNGLPVFANEQAVRAQLGSYGSGHNSTPTTFLGKLGSGLASMVTTPLKYVTGDTPQRAANIDTALAEVAQDYATNSDLNGRDVRRVQDAHLLTASGAIQRDFQAVAEAATGVSTYDTQNSGKLSMLTYAGAKLTGDDAKAVGAALGTFGLAGLTATGAMTPYLAAVVGGSMVANAAGVENGAVKMASALAMGATGNLVGTVYGIQKAVAGGSELLGKHGQEGSTLQTAGSSIANFNANYVDTPLSLLMGSSLFASGVASLNNNIDSALDTSLPSVSASNVGAGSIFDGTTDVSALRARFLEAGASGSSVNVASSYASADSSVDFVKSSIGFLSPDVGSSDYAGTVSDADLKTIEATLASEQADVTALKNGIKALENLPDAMIDDPANPGTQVPNPRDAATLAAFRADLVTQQAEVDAVQLEYDGKRTEYDLEHGHAVDLKKATDIAVKVENANPGSTLQDPNEPSEPGLFGHVRDAWGSESQTRWEALQAAYADATDEAGYQKVIDLNTQLVIANMGDNPLGTTAYGASGAVDLTDNDVTQTEITLADGKTTRSISMGDYLTWGNEMKGVSTHAAGLTTTLNSLGTDVSANVAALTDASAVSHYSDATSGVATVSADDFFSQTAGLDAAQEAISQYEAALRGTFNNAGQGSLEAISTVQEAVAANDYDAASKAIESGLERVRGQESLVTTFSDVFGAHDSDRVAQGYGLSASLTEFTVRDAMGSQDYAHASDIAATLTGAAGSSEDILSAQKAAAEYHARELKAEKLEALNEQKADLVKDGKDTRVIQSRIDALTADNTHLTKVQVSMDEYIAKDRALYHEAEGNEIIQTGVGQVNGALAADAFDASSYATAVATFNSATAHLTQDGIDTNDTLGAEMATKATVTQGLDQTLRPLAAQLQASYAAGSPDLDAALATAKTVSTVSTGISANGFTPNPAFSFEGQVVDDQFFAAVKEVYANAHSTFAELMNAKEIEGAQDFVREIATLEARAQARAAGSLPDLGLINGKVGPELQADLKAYNTADIKLAAALDGSGTYADAMAAIGKGLAQSPELEAAYTALSNQFVDSFTPSVDPSATAVPTTQPTTQPASGAATAPQPAATGTSSSASAPATSGAAGVAAPSASASSSSPVASATGAGTVDSPLIAKPGDVVPAGSYVVANGHGFYVNGTVVPGGPAPMTGSSPSVSTPASSVSASPAVSTYVPPAPSSVASATASVAPSTLTIAGVGADTNSVSSLIASGLEHAASREFNAALADLEQARNLDGDHNLTNNYTGNQEAQVLSLMRDVAGAWGNQVSNQIDDPNNMRLPAESFATNAEAERVLDRSMGLADQVSPEAWLKELRSLYGSGHADLPKVWALAGLNAADGMGLLNSAELNTYQAWQMNPSMANMVVLPDHLEVMHPIEGRQGEEWLRNLRFN